MGMLDKIKICSAIEAKRLSHEYFVINVASVKENPCADVVLPLITSNFIPMSKNIVLIPRLDILTFTIDYGLRKKGYVCVHCTAGLERSPLVVAWYLHIYESVSLDEAYNMIRQIRPQVFDRRSWIKYNSVEEFLEHSSRD